MLFYSRLASPSMKVFDGQRTVDTSAGIPVVNNIKTGWIRFEPMQVGHSLDERGNKRPGYVEIAALPAGRAQGRLDSEDAARQLRQKGHAILHNGLDITVRAVEEFLLNHPRYGLDFVSLDSEEVQQTMDDVGLLEIDEGQVYCTLCEKPFSSWGDARRHAAKSEPHQALAADKRAQEYKVPASESSAGPVIIAP